MTRRVDTQPDDIVRGTNIAYKASQLLTVDDSRVVAVGV